MIDLILAFICGYLWGERKEQNEQRKLELPRNITLENGAEFGYYKNKDEDLR